jgi:hypothetical protein
MYIFIKIIAQMEKKNDVIMQLSDEIKGLVIEKSG